MVNILKPDGTEVIGSEGLGSVGRSLQILLATNLEDPQILELMANGSDKTVVGALTGAIAKQVLDNGITPGVPIVTATLPTMMRNLDGECFWHDEKFKANRGRERSPLERALSTGDWAVHAAVGMGITRGKRRLSTPGSRKRQFREVAQRGYAEAIAEAQHPRPTENGLAQIVQLTAPVLGERFDEVVDILAGVVGARRGVASALLIDNGSGWPQLRAQKPATS